MNITIGDSGRELNLESIKVMLLGTKQSFDQYCDRLGLDEGEREELQDHLSGEIEKCSSCELWKESWDIVDNIGDMERVCNHCREGLYI